MGINANTKISDLLKQYSFLEDFLVTLSPKFKGLINPIMRKTIGKVTGIGGSDLDDFLAALTKEIERQVGPPQHLNRRLTRPAAPAPTLKKTSSRRPKPVAGLGIGVPLPDES